MHATPRTAHPTNGRGATRQPKVFLHTAPGTFLARERGELEILAAACVRSATYRGVQAADAEDLFGEACLAALARRGAQGPDVDLVALVLPAFRDRLARRLSRREFVGPVAAPLDEAQPASWRTDPLQQAWRSDLPDLEEHLLGQVSDLWRNGVQALLHGASLAAVARQQHVSSPRVQQVLERLRRVCMRDLRQLSEYLP